MMTTADVERALAELLELDTAMGEDAIVTDLASIATYKDAGLLTRDRGLVLTFASGLEVQLTIVRSANPTDDDPDGDDQESGIAAWQRDNAPDIDDVIDGMAGAAYFGVVS